MNNPIILDKDPCHKFLQLNWDGLCSIAKYCSCIFNEHWGYFIATTVPSGIAIGELGPKYRVNIDLTGMYFSIAYSLFKTKTMAFCIEHWCYFFALDETRWIQFTLPSTLLGGGYNFFFVTFHFVMVQGWILLLQWPWASFITMD